MDEEKFCRVRANLLIMRTLWKVYFQHVESNEKKGPTDFYEFIGMSSTMVSNIINGNTLKVKKQSVERLLDKTSMRADVLDGGYLIKIGGELEGYFKEQGYSEEEGWQKYMDIANDGGEFKEKLKKILYRELKKQKSSGFVDDELRKQLEYMRSVKGIIHTVERDISKVTPKLLSACTPKELEGYRKTLLEEYQLVTAIQTIRKSSKVMTEENIKINKWETEEE